MVGYAGSRSDLRDLELVVPALQELMARRPDVHFETFGMPAPQALALRWPDRVSTVGFSPEYGGYLRTLYTLGWDLGLCPLVDDEFNRCKTATKLAEYTACGIPALCSDVVPYRQVLGRVSAAPLVAPGDWPDALAAGAASQRPAVQAGRLPTARCATWAPIGRRRPFCRLGTGWRCAPWLAPTTSHSRVASRARCSRPP